MLKFVLLFSVSFVLAVRASGADPSFEKDVRPIFKAYCLDCHGAGEKMPGGLDLRLKRFTEAGGKSGPAFIAKQPDKSLFIERMKSGEMPPGEKKVPADQIAIIEKWIATGAATLREEPTTLPPGLGITADERAFWFYQPLQRANPPASSPADRVRTPVDAFVLAKLRERGLGFNADADKSTLVRRATFDLTGLPPSQKEHDDFVADASPDAYSNLLDRLLASPAYGERWARHWLDAAGYSDSDGDGTSDTVRPYAWRYRDYVIRSLNADKPLNRFIVEQLAGDELVPLPWSNLKPELIELLSATGFLRNAPDGSDAEQVVTDTIKIVSSSLLGSSVGCAQCHDHRYDPIPQRDYFQLRAIFEPALDPGQWRRPPQRRVSLFTDADRAKAAAIDAEAGKMQAEFNQKQTAAVRAAFEKEIAKFPEADRPKLKAAFDAPADKRTEEQKKLVATNPKLNLTPGVLYQYDTKADKELKDMQAKIQAKRAERPVEEFVSVMAEVPGRVPVTKLHHRGDARQPKGPDLVPADLTIAAPDGKRYEISTKDTKLPTTGRRLAWASYLTNGSHPLFNRVMANRLWLNHFGRGIVDTPGEFGKLGQLPSHPELLDWLATELPRQNWSLKQFHKLIMTSTVYRQTASRVEQDPANALYSRFPLRRLEGEAVRDRLLTVAGRLDPSAFGPSIAVVEDATGQVDVPDDKPRRSIYLQSRRSKPVAFLTTFDAPAGELNCERRNSTTSAPQSLTLLNGEFVRKQAAHFANRVVRETTVDPSAKPDADTARPADSWSYGYGGYDEKAKRTLGFTALMHYTGSSWQGGAVLPDPKVGWVILHAAGGHAGSDANHATIRRWIAPRDGTLVVSGKLGHPSPNGDGVRGRILSSRSGLLGEWNVKTKDAATDVTAVKVAAGDAIDFAVDCRGDVNSDSFTWPVKLTLTATGPAETWDSTADFRGPAPAPLAQLVAKAWQIAYLRSPTADERKLSAAFLKSQTVALRGKAKDPELAALTNLCQQLLASNEFLYVD
jgi:Protein of unknown function (DUF1549)/Protein of unknown function (DUF1553)/Planctomycete cytochrome C